MGTARRHSRWEESTLWVQTECLFSQQQWQLLLWHSVPLSLHLSQSLSVLTILLHHIQVPIAATNLPCMFLIFPSPYPGSFCSAWRSFPRTFSQTTGCWGAVGRKSRSGLARRCPAASHGSPHILPSDHIYVWRGDMFVWTEDGVGEMCICTKHTHEHRCQYICRYTQHSHKDTRTHHSLYREAGRIMSRGWVGAK